MRLNGIAHDVGFTAEIAPYERDESDSGETAELSSDELFDSGILSGEDALEAFGDGGTEGDTHDYQVLDADRYEATTVIPHSDDAEVRRYTLTAEELSTFIAEIDDPEIAETVVGVSAVEE